MPLSNRQVAKDSGEKTYHGKPCRNCGETLKVTVNGSCVSCKKQSEKNRYPSRAEYLKNWQENNRDKVNANAKAFRNRHPERVKASMDAWRQSNKDKIKIYTAQYYMENRDEILDKKAVFHSLNRSTRNRAKAVARSKAFGVNVMLTEAERAAVDSIYREAEILSGITGIPHQVDHVIPLSSDFLPGVHSPCNLQVVTANYNKRKRSNVDFNDYPEQKIALGNIKSKYPNLFD